MGEDTRKSESRLTDEVGIRNEGGVWEREKICGDVKRRLEIFFLLLFRRIGTALKRGRHRRTNSRDFEDFFTIQREKKWKLRLVQFKISKKRTGERRNKMSL